MRKRIEEERGSMVRESMNEGPSSRKDKKKTTTMAKMMASRSVVASKLPCCVATR
jgi:hypothetical protein